MLLQGRDIELRDVTARMGFERDVEDVAAQKRGGVPPRAQASRHQAWKASADMIRTARECRHELDTGILHGAVRLRAVARGLEGDGRWCDFCTGGLNHTNGPFC